MISQFLSKCVTVQCSVSKNVSNWYSKRMIFNESWGSSFKSAGSCSNAVSLVTYWQDYSWYSDLSLNLSPLSITHTVLTAAAELELILSVLSVSLTPVTAAAELGLSIFLKTGKFIHDTVIYLTSKKLLKWKNDQVRKMIKWKHDWKFLSPS